MFLGVQVHDLEAILFLLGRLALPPISRFNQHALTGCQ